jgi:hypothetical protein
MEPSGAGSNAGVVTDRVDADIALLQRRSTPVASWFAVVAALLFGLTLGYVLFSPNAATKGVAEQAVLVAPPPQTRQQEPIPPPPTLSEQPEPSAGEKLAPIEVQSGRRSAAGSRALGQKPAAEPKQGLSGLQGLGSQQATGPSAASSLESGPGTGKSLSSDQVQKVVASHTPSVKRSCWQPALDTREADAPTSARIMVGITIAPSGRVQSVTTSGDPRGYRGLASCIASRVRGWQFPASDETTPVNVPFVFAAQ